jgi:thiamine-phosphate pyrophosphorylase
MKLRGLYAITSDALVRDSARLLEGVAAALAGGAVLIQYRDKTNTPDVRRRNAQAVAALCRASDAGFVLNDGPLAWVAEDGLGGIHLGADDGPVAQARALLGPEAIIGATCGDSLLRAEAAAAAGASYLAFGAFFPSRTKPLARRVELPLLLAARQQFALPLCAIGGITPDNAAPLMAAGADLVAAVAGVFDAADIEAAARRYSALFAR